MSCVPSSRFPMLSWSSEGKEKKPDQVMLSNSYSGYLYCTLNASNYVKKYQPSMEDLYRKLMCLVCSF